LFKFYGIILTEATEEDEWRDLVFLVI